MQNVYVLHHSNTGCPESGEIHSIYATAAAAMEAMKKALDEEYDGATLDDNSDSEYMYITTQIFYSGS